MRHQFDSIINQFGRLTNINPTAHHLINGPNIPAANERHIAHQQYLGAGLTELGNSIRMINRSNYYKAGKMLGSSASYFHVSEVHQKAEDQELSDKTQSKHYLEYTD